MFAYRQGMRIFVPLILAVVTALAIWPAGAAAEEECENIAALEHQQNLHASEILVNCEVLPAGSGTGEEEEPLFGPGAFPGSDLNVITGEETYPHVTQSESFVWSHGETIVVAYNDSRGSEESPVNYSGASVSTNGGESFTRLGSSSPFTGHGANYGDPVVVYNEKLEKWFAGFLAGGCGGQGIGLWTSTNGEEWSAGACARSNSSDDRESMWVDNNPESPYYGRMYISFNDFTSSGALKVTHSDNGTSWSSPVTLLSSFRRNVQLTGSAGSDGTVFVAAQHENGGGVGNTGQQNYMYRSTNGGETWSSAEMGSEFTIAGSKSCGYFSAIPPIWRQTGWGQPAVGPNEVVHYVYAAHGEGEDESDIFYVRSTDNGKNWSEPLRLNTDSSGEAQWMPSLRVTPSGVVEASWYDRRNTTNGENYQRFARVSEDNGESWGEDEPLSTALIPQPTQPDPRVQACYAGDYNYTTANNTTGFDVWTDGRVSIEGEPVQKVFFHSVDLRGEPPAATTEAATKVRRRTATLNGTINPEGRETSYHFEYDTAEYKVGEETSHGTSVPVPDESIGSGESDIEVSKAITGLTGSTAYHYRVVAKSVAGTTYGEDETFTTKESILALEPPGGEFPASFSLAGEQEVSLRAGEEAISCTTEGKAQALGGEGQFEDATSGTATLTLRNCETEGFECHTAGEGEGTIEAEGLRLRLVYLSDGEPGVLFLPNAETEQFATASCVFELVPIEIAGNGVLGQITDPALGEPSPTLTIDLNAPEVGEGEYAQEYTETEAGAEYGLQVAVAEEEPEPAALEAEAVAEFSEGEAVLAEAGPVLEPPGGEFPASFSLAGEQEVSLRGGEEAISCTTEGKAQALGGEGQFEDASLGTATLTLRNCEYGGGFECHTAGEGEGTIKAEGLRLRLVYLSDGEPGVLFLPNAETEQFATASCVFELLPIEIAGNGVLGQITDPALGEPSPTLTIDLNAPEVGEGEYAQQYTETEAGAEYGLQVAVAGEKAEPAALEAEAVASFSGGEVELTEE